MGACARRAAARALCVQLVEPGADKPDVGMSSTVGRASDGTTMDGAMIATHYNYDMVTEPFSYAHGYHRLLVMVQQRCVRWATGRERAAPWPMWAGGPFPAHATSDRCARERRRAYSMGKDDVLRVCKAWTTFRPTFLAITKSLSQADLVFTEKCFRRAVLEFTKLLSYIGTPTCVWRRTGELAVVSKEFSLLTDWSAEDITARNITIYEVGVEAR